MLARLRPLLILGVLAVLFPCLAGAAIPGRVVAWGAGEPGSSGSVNFGQSTVPASALDGVVAITAGNYVSAALKDDGSLVLWGRGDLVSQLAVPSGVGGLTAFAIGTHSGHMLALRGNGTVAAWGENTFGQVNGVSPNVFQTAVADPVVLGGQTLSGVVAVTAGSNHSVALKNDGTVVAWGFNGLVTAVPAGLGGVIAIDAGSDHTIALKSDGTVVVWGSSSQTNVPAGLTGVVAVAAGYAHSLALKSDGTVVAWGGNNFWGENNVPAGLNGVVAIGAGDYHSFALKSDGTVVGWGDNAYDKATPPPSLPSCVWALTGGQGHSLALVGAPATFVTPPASQVRLVGQTAIFTADISGTPPFVYQWYKNGSPLADGGRVSGVHTATLTITSLVPADAGAYSVEVGNCAADAPSEPAILTINPVVPPGEVVAWGDDTFGQSAVPLAAKSGVIAVAAGQGHTLALKANGQLLAWGWNSSGQLDVPFATLNGSVAIAAGQAHSLALRNDGVVFAWGNNAEGQTNVPAGLSGVVAISAGGSHSLALKNDGTVVAWGHNGFGQSAVPTGLADVTAIAAGMYHTLALKADGTVVAWGDDSQGQSTVPAGLSDVVAIAAGLYHSAATRADGTVVVWGSDSHGQSTVPAGLALAFKVAAGRHHTVALKTDRTLAAWGDDSAGQSAVPAAVQGRALALAAGWAHTVVIAGRKPLILAGPYNLYANLGQHVTFTVDADGTPPLEFAWRRQSAMGSSDIPGATTATLGLADVQFSQGATYTVTVSNAFGSATAAAALTVLPATTYAQWSAARFTPEQLANPAVSGPLADPSARGTPNLLKYAFHLEPPASAGGPGSPSVNPPSSWPLQPTHAGDALQLVFQAIRPDLAYTVEASTDLVTWSETGVRVEANGTARTATFAPPMPSARAFLRIVVTLPEE